MHAHAHTHMCVYICVWLLQENGTEEKVFKKRKVFNEDLKELTDEPVEREHQNHFFETVTYLRKKRHQQPHTKWV